MEKTSTTKIREEIKATWPAHMVTEAVRLKLYVGAYASLWMLIETLGTMPKYYIVDNETNEVVSITGTNWSDLRDVMDSLKIYEYEKMEEAI